MSASPESSGPGTAPMRPLITLVQVAKRLGLAKPVVRLAFGRMMSRKAHEKAFARYTPTEHDVFVATFGKSGTNWMMQIAQQIAHRGRAEFEHIHRVVAWPDAPGGGMGIVPLADPAPLEQSPTGLRVIKTHADAEIVPYDEKAIYLTVLRDPKEVAVSSYYFIGGLFGVLSHLDIDDWIDLFLSRASPGAAWARHTASFWEWRHRPNVLVLNYREVKRDPRGCIERVADRMGVTLSDEELARVVLRSSFEYMHAHESQFAPPKLPFIDDEDRPRMVRRGASGGSAELLSTSQQAAIDRFCRARLRELGSDFPYPDEFDAIEEPATTTSATSS